MDGLRPQAKGNSEDGQAAKAQLQINLQSKLSVVASWAFIINEYLNHFAPEFCRGLISFSRGCYVLDIAVGYSEDGTKMLAEWT